jgi:hypothetical protein
MTTTMDERAKVLSEVTTEVERLASWDLQKLADASHMFEEFDMLRRKGRATSLRVVAVHIAARMIVLVLRLDALGPS